MSEIFGGQPWTVISIAVIFGSIFVARYATPLLAQYLGVTDSSARRLTGVLVIGLVLLLAVTRISMRSGGVTMDGIPDLVAQYWWVALLLVPTLLRLFRPRS